jgi:hypothetical protein
MAFLYANSPAAASLARVLAELRVPLRLRRFPAHSFGLAAVGNAFRKRGVVLSRDAGGCPYIPLDERHKEHEGSLSARRQSDLRRARRRAERLGQVSCEVRSPTPAELEPLVDEALRVEAASWKGAGGHRP